MGITAAVVSWTLILMFSHGSEGIAVAPVYGFATEMGCMEAGKAVKAKAGWWQSAEFVCAKTSVPLARQGP